MLSSVFDVFHLFGNFYTLFPEFGVGGGFVLVHDCLELVVELFEYLFSIMTFLLYLNELFGLQVVFADSLGCSVDLERKVVLHFYPEEALALPESLMD